MRHGGKKPGRAEELPLMNIVVAGTVKFLLLSRHQKLHHCNYRKLETEGGITAKNRENERHESKHPANRKSGKDPVHGERLQTDHGKIGGRSENPHK